MRSLERTHDSDPAPAIVNPIMTLAKSKTLVSRGIGVGQRNKMTDHKHIKADGSVGSDRFQCRSTPIDYGRLQMTPTMVDYGRLRTTLNDSGRLRATRTPNDSDSERL